MVATDHSPCPPELKKANGSECGRFDSAWGGIASLGLALPVVWTGLHQRGGGLELLARWMAAEPAALAGLTGRKGALMAGCDADLVIFEPDAEWTVTEQDLVFRHKLSPYLGARLRGRVLETYLRGECILWRRDAGCLIDPKARGQELRRGL